MRSKTFAFITILTITIFFVGCSSDNTPNTTGNRSQANTNSSSGASNANNPLATTRKPEAATSNNAPTLAPVVQGYYAALQKKDEASVKKFLSQSALKYWEAEMKSEKKNSLLAILEDNEFPVEEKRDVRNEKMEGDTAVAELKGGSLGVWTPVAFVKENGEWKLESPEKSLGLQNIPKTDSK